MASAYAALVSLMNVLHIIIHPKHPASHLHKSQIQFLFDKVNSVVELLETHSNKISKDLQRKMTDAAFAAEDMIESYLVEIQQAMKAKDSRDSKRRLTRWWLRLTRSSVPVEIQKSMVTLTADETSRPLIAQHLHKAIQEMDLIIQEAMLQVDQNNGEQDDQLLTRGLVPDVGSRSTPVTRGDAIKIVGLEEETNRLIDQLTCHQSNRQIIPIVGMGGLGKTTLAKNVYNHPCLRHHFDVKAWVTVSQVYSNRSIIAPLLRDIGVHGMDEMNDEDLGDILHKRLFSRRYLIIVDDIWEVHAWDGMIRFCPDNNNGSRILLTTRLLDVANRVSSCSPLDMQLLGADKSWDLLSEMVFGQEVVPTELEHCGKEIARSCKGLPLAIVVIAGLLKVSDRTQKHWERVGRNIRSIIGTEDNENCMKILALSYHQLPIHLKPCFLYMATFPEDYNIKVSEVTKLWAADGFLKPRTDGKTLDEVALECLTELVSRNLVIVNERNHRGEMKRLTTHDLVRDLCIKEARQNETFLYADDGVANLPNSIQSERRLVFHGIGSQRHISRCMRQMGLSRSFIWFRKQHLSAKMPWLSLLRVMVSSGEICRVQDIMRLVNLRLLKFSIKKDEFKFLPSISWAMNLETLILNFIPARKDSSKLPVEIWNLWRLKHLIVVCLGNGIVILPDPPTGSDFVHEKLETLRGVLVCGDIVLSRIPNIKILKIRYQHDNNSVDFGHCQKLEKLHFDTYTVSCLEQYYKFPSYLRKLMLSCTKIRWENMTIIGSLPNLEFLDLQFDAFIGEEWESVEGEFQKLTYLNVEYCEDLVRWIVEESSHFPSLEHLKLLGMDKLEEIPLVFGELMTLVSIKVRGRSKSSLVISAREILEEQQQGGNDDLIVDVYHRIHISQYSAELEEELKGLPNDNFHLKIKKENY